MKKIALFIGFFCITSAAYGYALNGRKWFSSAEAKFYLNNANGAACCLSTSQQANEITSGITPWGIASYGGTTSKSGAKQDGQNVISWAKLGGTTLAVTHYISTDTSQSQVCNGTLIYRFVEVDVRFNNAFSWQTSNSCTNGFHLQGVSTHEFGHAVGLSHSDVREATMYPSVAACDFSISSLANDDKAGYSHIYSGCR